MVRSHMAVVDARRSGGVGRAVYPALRLIVLVSFAVCSPVTAGAVGGPTGQIERLFTDANRVLRESATGGPAERLDAVLRVVGPALSFRDAAEAALGLDWQARSPSEQEEFAQLFTALLARAVVVGVAGRARLGARGIAVEYLDESVTGSTATVRTAVPGRDGGRVAVDYRLTRRDGHWVIHDVAIDGISIVGTYRAQVAHVLQSSSYGDLLTRMRAKHVPDVPAGAPVMRTARSTPPVHAEPILPEPTVRPAQATAAATASDAMVASVDDHGSGAPDRAGTEASVLLSRATPDTKSAIGPRPVLPGAIPGRSAESADRAPRPAGTAEPMRSSDPPPAPDRVAPGQGRPVGSHVRRADGIPDTPGTKQHEGWRPSYWVQVSAFSNVEGALRLATRLLQQDYAVSMEPGQLSGAGQRLTRVRVGPFADRAAASVMLERLRRSGYTPFLAVERQ